MMFQLISMFIVLVYFALASAWPPAPPSQSSLSMSPQALTVTTEANIALTGSLLLITGDDDTDNDAIDLQDGTTAGQLLFIVAVALVDANDTITVAMTDTTCTGCLTVLMDEVGDTWGLVWTGSTWATISNSEVP